MTHQGFRHKQSDKPTKPIRMLLLNVILSAVVSAVVSLGTMFLKTHVDNVHSLHDNENQFVGRVEDIVRILAGASGDLHVLETQFVNGAQTKPFAWQPVSEPLRHRLAQQREDLNRAYDTLMAFDRMIRQQTSDPDVIKSLDEIERLMIKPFELQMGFGWSAQVSLYTHNAIYPEAIVQPSNTLDGQINALKDAKTKLEQLLSRK